VITFWPTLRDDGIRMRVNMTAAPAAAGNAWARARRATDDISGEVALVTGASRGLGLLLAGELARRSCRLIITARDGAELDQAAGRLRSAGAEVVAAACDIRDEHAPQLLLDTAREHDGRLDILVNNAGIIQVGPAQNVQIGSNQSALDTMALSMVRMSLAALLLPGRPGPS
jgi:short-subunit dehydrogenase